MKAPNTKCVKPREKGSASPQDIVADRQFAIADSGLRSNA